MRRHGRHGWLWPQKLFLILPLLSSSTRITNSKPHSPPLAYSQSISLLIPCCLFDLQQLQWFFENINHVISFPSALQWFPSQYKSTILTMAEKTTSLMICPIVPPLLPTPASTITIPVQIPKSCYCFWLGSLSSKYPHILSLLQSPLSSNLTSPERDSLTPQSKKQSNALSMHADWLSL